MNEWTKRKDRMNPGFLKHDSEMWRWYKSCDFKSTFPNFILVVLWPTYDFNKPTCNSVNNYTDHNLQSPEILSISSVHRIPFLASKFFIGFNPGSSFPLLPLSVSKSYPLSGRSLAVTSSSNPLLPSLKAPPLLFPVPSTPHPNTYTLYTCVCAHPYPPLDQTLWVSSTLTATCPLPGTTC